MKTHLDQVERELKDELLALRNLAPQERYALALERIDQAVGELRKFMDAHDPKETEEEIYIFKHLRPQLLSYRIEEALLYNLAINQPIGTPHTLSKYLEDIAEGLQSFFRLNGFYYQYYKNEFHELDRLYFTREGRSAALPVPEITEQDTPFSTPMSNLFAKFMAYERIQYFISEQIVQLGNKSNLQGAPAETATLKWTGELVNLVELVYGLWLTGQLNNGNASLNQIVRWLEGSLGVSLGVIQRKFTEIERRKRYSHTKFIDRMKKAIIEKMEDDHE